nr:uncharacterized protein LOC127347503 [Lolium perenne]
MAPRCTTPTPVQPSSPAATAPNPRPASFPAAAAAANPRPAFFPAAAAANPRPAFFPGGNRAESPPSLLPRGGGGESPPSLYAPPRRASTRRPGETLRAAPESPPHAATIPCVFATSVLLQNLCQLCEFLTGPATGVNIPDHPSPPPVSMESVSRPSGAPNPFPAFLVSDAAGDFTSRRSSVQHTLPGSSPPSPKLCRAATQIPPACWP